MPESTWQALGGLIGSIAADGIRIQERLSAASDVRQQEFAAMVASLPDSMQVLLAPMAPPRLALKEHQLRCSLRVAAARSLGLSLAVTPINLGYAALYETTREEESSITVEVVAVSMPTNM